MVIGLETIMLKCPKTWDTIELGSLGSASIITMHLLNGISSFWLWVFCRITPHMPSYWQCQFCKYFERADIFISDNALWGLAQQQEWNRCTRAMRPQNLPSDSKQFEPCCPYPRLTLWLLNPPTRFKKRWETCVKHLQIWIIGVENRRYTMQNQDTMHTISSRISMQVAINPGKILVITLGCMAGKQWTSITRANRVTGIMMSFSYKAVGTNVSRQELGVNFPFRKERRDSYELHIAITTKQIYDYESILVIFYAREKQVYLQNQLF